MNDQKIACSCHNVTYGAVRAAIQNGATSLDTVMATTGAGTACGKCREFLACLVRDILTEKDT